MSLHKRTAVTLLGFFLGACSAPLPGKKETAAVAGGGASPKPGAGDQNPDLEKLDNSSLRVQVQTDMLETKQKEAVRLAICAELQTLRNKAECQGLMRLAEDSKVLSCLDSGNTNQSLKREFVVSAVSAGSVKLSVNDGEYFSTSFNANGQPQVLTFKNPGDKDKLSPRLVDVTKIAVIDGGNQPVSLSSIQLKINGKNLGVMAVGAEIDINAMKSSFTSSDECRKSQSDVSQIEQSASANVSLDQAQKDSIAQMTRERLLQEIGTAKTRREIANSQILAVEKEMLADQDRGCWLDKSLETMELVVRGQMTGCGNGTDYQLEIKLADTTIQRSASGVLAQPLKAGTLLSGKKLRNLAKITARLPYASGSCAAPFTLYGMDLRLDGQVVAKIDTGPVSGLPAGAVVDWFDASTTPQFLQIKNLGGCKSNLQ